MSSHDDTPGSCRLGSDTAMVETADHVVAIVLDPDFGEGIGDLAGDRQVWVVGSEANDAAIAAIWRNDLRTRSPENGVTRFDGRETPEASFLGILSAVELHHGEYSHDPALAVLEVVGLEPSDPVRDALAMYGFGVVDPSANGFVARRTHVQRS